MIKMKDVVLYGTAVVNEKDKRMYALRVEMVSQTALNSFNVKWTPAPGWKINIGPIKGNLGPGQITEQTLYLLNENGAPFFLSVALSYRYGAQPLTDSATIKVLPTI